MCHRSCVRSDASPKRHRNRRLVDKENIDIRLEKNELTVEGLIDFDAYRNYTPVYTEYNIGHFSRSFTLSNVIDKNRIEAKVDNGVLTLTLPKIEEATPRKINVH